MANTCKTVCVHPLKIYLGQGTVLVLVRIFFNKMNTSSVKKVKRAIILRVLSIR